MRMTRQEFIDTYIPLGEGLYRVAFYILESRDDAEDAVQDLYIKLWNSRSTLDSVKNPKSWCTALMKNICIDRIRRKSGNGHAELHDNIMADGSADDRTIGEDTMRRMSKAIDSLPGKQKEVLKLKVLKEMSNDEISQRTGMSNLTVRVLLSQARKTLRKIL